MSWAGGVYGGESFMGWFIHYGLYVMILFVVQLIDCYIH